MPIYLNLATVKGESQAEGHQGWIELETFLLGTEKAGDRDQDVTQGTSDQDRTVLDASCTRELDSTSPTLRRLSITGDPQAATIDLVDRRGFIFTQVRCSDAIITFHSFSDLAGGQPAETFILTFSKMTRIEFARRP
jgi:type VI protein secretion system component Hcp